MTMAAHVSSVVVLPGIMLGRWLVVLYPCTFPRENTSTRMNRAVSSARNVMSGLLNELRDIRIVKPNRELPAGYLICA